MVERIRVNFPAGRMVQGDLYKANDTDFVTKQKRVYPAGHRLAGQPKITYFFALAVKKNGEQHWAQTPWGQQIYQFTTQAWPVDPRTGVSPIQRPDFAWKIEDGDSTVPNKNNRINARTEGFAGCWIISFSSVYPPKIITTDFTPITEPNAVKRGFWVEPVGTVDTNESQGNPGIYINGEFVMFRAIDKEISGMVDPRTIQGFGQSALPAGVTPVGNPSGVPGSPPPFGVQTPPGPQFPTSGAPLPPAGFGGAPFAAQPPALSPGPVTSPFSPPQMPPGITSVPGFLPNAAPPGFASAPQAGPVPFANPGAAGPIPSPNAPAPAYQLPGAAPVAPGPNGYAQYGAQGNGPFTPGAASTAPIGAQPAYAGTPMAPSNGPVLTAKCPPGTTWVMMQQQGWTIETARAQGYVQ